MKPSLSQLALLALAAIALPVSVSALSLTPANAAFFWAQNGNIDENDVETKTGSLLQLTEQYKQNQGGNEEKAFAGSYSTTFPAGLKGATVTYDGSPDPIITGSEIWALAKDGAHGHYLWNISTWDGMEQIVMSGLWPNQGSMSHVSIFSGGQAVRTPDGGATVALLGLALGLIAIARRMFA